MLDTVIWENEPFSKSWLDFLFFLQKLTQSISAHIHVLDEVGFIQNELGANKKILIY